MSNTASVGHPVTVDERDHEIGSLRKLVRDQAAEIARLTADLRSTEADLTRVCLEMDAAKAELAAARAVPADVDTAIIEAVEAACRVTSAEQTSHINRNNAEIADAKREYSEQDKILRAAIAADRARAVAEVTEDIAKPLARRMAAEETLTATMIAYVVSGLRRVGLLRIGPGDIDAVTWARLAEAIDEARRVPAEMRAVEARPTPDDMPDVYVKLLTAAGIDDQDRVDMPPRAQIDHLVRWVQQAGDVYRGAREAHAQLHEANQRIEWQANRPMPDEARRLVDVAMSAAFSLGMCERGDDDGSRLRGECDTARAALLRALVVES